MNFELGIVLFFILFFTSTFIFILRRNLIFAIFYFFLFLYTIFTQIGYIYFPKMIAQGSGGRYYGLDIFYDYSIFVFLSFFLIFLFFTILFKKRNSTKHSISMARINIQPIFRNILFIYVIIIFDFLLAYFLITNYSSLSYLEQGALKGNSIFFFLFNFCIIVLLILYVKFKSFDKFSFLKFVYGMLATITLSIFLLISIRAGQKIGISSLVVGILVYNLFFSKYSEKDKNTKLGIVKNFIFIIFIVVFFKAMNSNRVEGYISIFEFGGNILNNFIGRLEYIFSLEGIVAQDYTGPSVTLFASMYYNIVIPFEALQSIISNSLIHVSYPTLGYIVSQVMNPRLSDFQGYGYYFLTEGYNLLGWGGIFYNAIVFNFGLYIWNKLADTDDYRFKGYMTAVIVTQVFNIVRFQSSTFLRAFPMVFVPAIILYALAMGYVPYLNTAKKRALKPE